MGSKHTKEVREEKRTLGNRLLAACEARGWDRETTAKRLGGVSVETLHRWSLGRAVPGANAAKLQKVIEAVQRGGYCPSLAKSDGSTVYIRPPNGSAKAPPAQESLNKVVAKGADLDAILELILEMVPAEMLTAEMARRMGGGK